MFVLDVYTPESATVSTFISISIGPFVLHFFGCLAICDAAVEAIGDGSLPVPSSLLDSIFNRYCDIIGNMLRIYLYSMKTIGFYNDHSVHFTRKDKKIA